MRRTPPDFRKHPVERHTPRREAPSAPLKGLAAVAIYGVQMLNAEPELAAVG